MKKILVMCAVVVAAIAANAATVNWMVNNVYTPTASLLSPGKDGGGSKMATSVSTLVATLYWDANKGVDTVNWQKITSANALTSEGVIANSSFWDQATAEANRAADGKSAYYKVVLTYSDATGSYTTEALTTTTKLGNISSSAVNVTFNFNNKTWTYTPEEGGIPEPTSALLFVLGGAMLALRRRRA